jgi:hypothetical protein
VIVLHKMAIHSPNPTGISQYAQHDRRGNASSRVVNLGPLNTIQSARDVVAIIKALGYTKAPILELAAVGLLPFKWQPAILNMWIMS